jgi:PBP4 family serine-type D-alanyl-D-alanine carboxypeptidase
MHPSRFALAAALLVAAAGARSAHAQVAQVAQQNKSTGSRRVDDVIGEIRRRPELVHAAFGAAAYDLDTHEMVYALNAEQLFTPGSTTKLLTTGTALAVLGDEYRFHTPVYRTGPIVNGIVKGDVVLVGSGDPNLSGRILGDTLGFTNEDHSYAGRGDSVAKAIGDPLSVMRRLAAQIAGRGIREIEGRVLVDVSLFPQGERELGTGVVISPVILNDNVVDLLIAPANAGEPARVQPSPDLGMFMLANDLKTGPPGSAPMVHRAIARDSSGGVHVTVSGSYPAGGAPLVMSIPVDDPAQYAARALVAALKDRGVVVRGGVAEPGRRTDFTRLAGGYADSTRVAEHVSLPLAEAVKVILKVSQNLHASTLPYIVGAVAGHTPGPGALQAGFDQEHDFLERAGLDLLTAGQGDGAGGAASAFYSPEFMVKYLAFMATRPDTTAFHRALPILGRDGTLWNIQPATPAAGHVFAKTGTFSVFDPLNRRTIVTGKGLAGYMTTSSGRRLAFAIYANRVPFPRGYQGDGALLVGQALGEIAAAMWGM